MAIDAEIRNELLAEVQAALAELEALRRRLQQLVDEYLTAFVVNEAALNG